jgi:hypothetical protein
MKKLNEELLRQLLLMNFDGSKTLLEQEVPSDRLGNKGDFQPSRTAPKFNPNKTEDEIYEDDKQSAIRSYNKIVNEIDGGWAPWKWGTDEQGMSDAILSIKNKQQYQILRNLLSKKYKDSAYPNTLLGFIQEQEFSLGEDPWLNDMIRKSPSGLGQEYQYQTNDKFLRQIESHLEKFNTEEKFSRAGVMNRSLTSLIIPSTASQVLHTIIPVLSIVTMMIPPASIAFELLDAGLYLAEGDKYSAGLGFCFAFIPAGQFAMLSRTLSKGEKLILMKKVQKEAAGEVFEKYTEKEVKILASLGDEGTKKMLKKEVAKRAITETIDEMTSINVLYKSIWWMVKKGYLPAKFLTQMGVTIGGVFRSWDYIASVLKVCNPMGLTKLSDTEKGYLQMIGGVAKFLQKYSTDCEDQRALKNFQDQVRGLEKDVKSLVLKRLQNIIDSNINLTMSKYQSTYTLETLSIQLALRNLGYTKFTEIKTTFGTFNEPLPAKSPTNVPPLPQQQTYDPTGGIGASRKVSGLPSTGTPTLDTKLSLKSSPITEKKVVDVVFKWGYYDYNTSMVVKDFQKKNNLKIDGETGANTTKKIMEKIKVMSGVNPYDSKIDKLTKDEILKIEESIVKKIQSENQNPLKESDLEKKLDPSQMVKIKKEFRENVTDKIQDMDPNSWNINFISDEYDSEYPKD